MSFKSHLEILKSLPRSPFAVPVDLDTTGLSGVINHLLNFDKETRFDFVVVEDGVLLSGCLREHLQSRGRSTEKIVTLECVEKQKLPPSRDVSEHPDWVSALCGSEGIVATGCYDGAMRLYDTSDGKFLAVGAAHSEPVKGVAFLSNNSKGKADCQMLASVSKDSTAVVWRFEDSQLTSVGLCVGHDNSVETIAARPRCDNGVVQFATGGWDRTVRLWSWPLATSSSTEETLANEEAATLDIRHAKKRRVASKSSESMDTPNSNVATADGVAKIESSESLMGHSGCITSMGWVGDDKLCTGSWDRSLRVWDMNAGVCESTVSCKRVISNLAVQPNESAVCTVHPDGKARLWDLRISEGESIVAAKTFSGHKGWVSSVSWVDERTFVTSGYDGSVVLWDVRGDTPIDQMSGAHKGKALCALAIDKKLVSGGSDGTLRWFEQR